MQWILYLSICTHLWFQSCVLGVVHTLTLSFPGCSLFLCQNMEMAGEHSQYNTMVCEGCSSDTGLIFVSWSSVRRLSSKICNTLFTTWVWGCWFWVSWFWKSCSEGYTPSIVLLGVVSESVTDGRRFSVWILSI